MRTIRDKAVDEFQAIYERASIPALQIQPLELKRVAVVLKGHALDASALTLAQELRERFPAVELTIHTPAAAGEPASLAAARAGGWSGAAQAFHSTAELIGQFGLARTQLIVLPEPAEAAERVIDVDDLVGATAPPVLVVRSAVAAGQAVFGRVLHSLSGNFRQARNFSYSFALTRSGGALRLLHTIDRDELEDVRETLRVSELSAQAEDEILETLRHHGERYLRGVVSAARSEPFEVSYELKVGDVVAEVQAELAAGGWGLLVVGRHAEGFSQVTAADYRLMHQVREVPVLAL